MSYSALRKGRHSQEGQVYHIITRTRQHSRLFEEFPLACCFCQTLQQLTTDGKCSPLCWVLMPDHLHVLITLRKNESLAKVAQLIKGRTSRNINICRGRRSPVWQPAFFDRALRREDDVKTVARYIVANPLRAGLVDDIGDYPFWDAVWL